MLGLRWWHKVSNCSADIEALLIQRQLRRVDHSIRMPEDGLPDRPYKGSWMMADVWPVARENASKTK